MGALYGPDQYTVPFSKAKKKRNIFPSIPRFCEMDFDGVCQHNILYRTWVCHCNRCNGRQKRFFGNERKLGPLDKLRDLIWLGAHVLVWESSYEDSPESSDMDKNQRYYSSLKLYSDNTYIPGVTFKVRIKIDK